MKGINYWTIVICLGAMIWFSGCNSISSTSSIKESAMEKCFNIEDFQSITIGESTYQDVYKVAPVESIQVTSYGGFCEYPTQNGGNIRVKFYGNDLIVGAIEEVP